MAAQTTPALGYRVSYDGSHWRVMRRRGDVDERRLAATFPDVQAAQRAVDRLYYSHGLETPIEERRVGEEEAYWRSIALAPGMEQKSGARGGVYGHGRAVLRQAEGWERAK